jgi:archaellum component FlaC
MITDVDVKKLNLERFLTKKDFKKEIGKYATKDALEKLDARTAEGFLNVQNQLSEIKEDLSGVKEDLSGVKEDVTSLKEDVKDIKNTLLNMQDKIYGELLKLNIENKVTSTYKPRIEDHEKRITKVESVVFAS